MKEYVLAERGTKDVLVGQKVCGFFFILINTYLFIDRFDRFMHHYKNGLAGTDSI